MGAERKNELHVHFCKVKYRERAIQVTSNNHFFKNKEVKYDVYYDKITFKVASIDDRKRVIKPKESKVCKNSFSMSIHSDNDIKFGDYLIDEDSMNEDEITIYLND